MAAYTAIIRVTVITRHAVQPIIRHMAVTLEAASFAEAYAEAQQHVTPLSEGNASELVALGLSEHVTLSI